MAIFTSPGCLIGNVLIYLTPSTGYYYAVAAEFIIALTCGAVYMLTTGLVAKFEAKNFRNIFSTSEKLR